MTWRTLIIPATRSRQGLDILNARHDLKDFPVNFLSYQNRIRPRSVSSSCWSEQQCPELHNGGNLLRPLENAQLSQYVCHSVSAIVALIISKRKAWIFLSSAGPSTIVRTMCSSAGYTPTRNLSGIGVFTLIRWSWLFQSPKPTPFSNESGSFLTRRRKMARQ